LTDLLDLSFDLYSRHRLVQRVADCARQVHGKSSLRVLDVGGYPCYTPRFLPDDHVVVADLVEPAPESPPTGYLRADGAALPFRDGAFDVVVSLDSLEHVPAGRREDYVSELLRCSADYVLLVAPFAQDETVLADGLLAAFARVFDQEESPQLVEHQVYGLPKLEQWLAFVRARGAECISFSSGFVYNWLPMMLVKYYLVGLPDTLDLHHALDRFYNTMLQRSDARPPGYRQGILASKNGHTTVLGAMEQELRAVDPPDRMEIIERMGQIDLVLKLADLHVKWRRDESLREDILAKSRHIENLETLLQAERDRVGDLEGDLASIQRGRVMRTLNALHRLVRWKP